MIIETEKQEIRQTPPVVQFQSDPPSHNPFVPSLPMAVRRKGDSILMEWISSPDSTSQDEPAGLGPSLIERSEREVQKYPNRSRARTNLAVALANGGEVDRAISVFRDALELNSSDYVAASNLAKILVEQNRLNEAEVMYEDLSARFPRNVTPLIGLAVLAMRRGRFDEAEALLNRGASLGVRSAALDYNLALISICRGDTNSAIKTLRAALQLDGRSPALYQALGITYALAGNDVKSSRAFHTALRLSPHSGDAVRGLANTLMHIGQIDVAIETLADYLQRNPSDPKARLILARAYLGKGRYSSARSQFMDVYTSGDESLEADAKSELANDIAFCYHADRDVDTAESWFDKSIKHSPLHGTLPYRNLACIYLGSDRAQSAITLMEECKSLFPQDEKVVLLLAISWDLAGKTEKAISELEPLANSASNDEVIFALLGGFLAELRLYDRAFIVLEAAWKKFPKSDLVANNLAYVYLMGERVSDAQEVLESTTGQSVALTATRGLLQLKQGNLEAAHLLYSDAAKLAFQGGDRAVAMIVKQKMHLEFARHYMLKGDVAAATRELNLGLKTGKGRPRYQVELQQIKGILEAKSTM